MITVAIAGAAGRMGQTILRCSLRMPDIKVVSAVEFAGHPALGKDIGELAGIPCCNVPLTADLAAALEKADVLIDFTLHDAVPNNTEVAKRLRRAMVIGATGLNPEETAKVTDASAIIPIVWTPNMSLGVNLLFAMVKKAASILGPAYSVEMEETHHIHKKDAPSGTALRLAEKVAEGFNKKSTDLIAHDPEGKQNLHTPDKIVIRSYRRGEVIGDHTVSFQTEGEKIELSHHAATREAFAMGALRAAAWVSSARPGRIYDMQDVLGLK